MLTGTTVSSRNPSLLGEIFIVPKYEELEQSKVLNRGTPSGVSIWDMKDSNETFIKELSIRSKKNVSTVSFSPDGRYLASLDCDGHVNIWATHVS